jgi:hypothetical protein
VNGTTNERKALRLAVGSVALVAASAFAAAALAAGGSLSDPADDNTGAVDISSVEVSEPAAGRIRVAVSVGNTKRLPAGSRVDLWFDLDNNLKTGDEGDEALARYQANGTLAFSRWDGDDLVKRPATGMTARFESGTLTYEAPRAALDNVPSFGLLVITRGVQEAADEDATAYDALPEIGRVSYASPGPRTFQDRKADVPRAADVRSVTVTDAKNGMIRFKVTTFDPSLLNDSVVSVAIDRDLLGGDGPIDRAEVLLDYADGRLDLLRWDPVEEDWLDDEAPTRARAGIVGSSVVFEIHRSELDDVARFGFTVETWIEDEDGDVAAFDLAPGKGGSRYALVHRPALRLIAGELFGTPSRPVAGRPFTINLPVTRSDTARKLVRAKITCNVRADGRRVRATPSIVRGVARCGLVVPRNALDVRGSMTVRSAGRSVTAWFAGAIDFGGGVEGEARSR